MAKSKLSSIENLVLQALIDMEISQEEFITILKKKDKYEKTKENLRNVSENKKIWDSIILIHELKNKLCEKYVQIRTDLCGFVCLF